MTNSANRTYRWPAEWEPHAATWVAWPHNEETWPGKFEPVPRAFADMVRAIAQFEPVHILAGAEPLAAQANDLLNNVSNIVIHNIATDDAWVRDYGPTFVLDKRGEQLQAIDWRYNAWGGKYPPWENDAAAAEDIARVTGANHISSEFFIEGGAIEGNGAGELLTTKSCLLNPNRTPRPVDQIEAELRSRLGAKRIHWLSGGSIAGDDTDGHIDQVARFVNETTILVAAESDANDENYGVLRQLAGELLALRDAAETPFEIIPLPMPNPIYFQDQRLPASYANFCFVNGGIIVPQFHDAADELVMKVFGELAPDRQIVGVDCRDLVLGLGGPHCLTQQQPAT